MEDRAADSALEAAAEHEKSSIGCRTFVKFMDLGPCMYYHVGFLLPLSTVNNLFNFVNNLFTLRGAIRNPIHIYLGLNLEMGLSCRRPNMHLGLRQEW